MESPAEPLQRRNPSSGRMMFAKVSAVLKLDPTWASFEQISDDKNIHSLIIFIGNENATNLAIFTVSRGRHLR